MRRFSVRTLMVLIVGAAVGLVALRDANVFWASAIATVVVVAVATSVVGALTVRGRERYAWAGFAVFSGVYLAVAVGTVLSDRFKDYFGPTVALEYVQSKVLRGWSDPVVRKEVSSFQQMMAHQRILLQQRIAALQPPTDEVDRQQLAALHAKAQVVDAHIQNDQASLGSADRWRSWLPGAANTNEFRCVGHCLFALLFGLAGTVVGRIFYARRERSETQAT